MTHKGLAGVREGKIYLQRVDWPIRRDEIPSYELCDPFGCGGGEEERKRGEVWEGGTGSIYSSLIQRQSPQDQAAEWGRHGLARCSPGCAFAQLAWHPWLACIADVKPDDRQNNQVAGLNAGSIVIDGDFIFRAA